MARFDHLRAGMHITNTMDIIKDLLQERYDAIDAGDQDFAIDCLTSAVDCARMITDRLGPEWFTDDEVELIENLFMEYAHNG